MNGKITSNTLQAPAGTKIKLSIITDKGYQLKQNTLNYNGILIISDNFVMPNEDVVVSAEFEKLKEDENDEPSGSDLNNSSGGSSIVIRRPYILESFMLKIYIMLRLR